MITDERMTKYLSSLRPHAATVARRNQKYHIPIVFTNNTNIDETTHIDDKAEAMKTSTDKRFVLISNTEQYRYNGRWYTYHFSVDKPEETFGILKVNDYLITNLINKERKKTFVGRLDTLSFQGLIKPFMLFIDHKFVNWDNIEVIYDCDDIWLILRGENYNFFALKGKEVNIVILPFKCEYFGEEPQWLFDLYYTALNEYIQNTCEIIDDELYIYSPTLDTEYVYNGMAMNVGGWLYNQIKKYALGILSSDRINKLRNIIIFKNTVNANGDIIESLSTKYNGLDKDVPTNKTLYDSLCYMPLDKYNEYPEFAFNDSGLYDINGQYKVKLMDTDIVHRHKESEESKIIYDLSDIDNTLFRENYLVFENGLFIPNYKIIGSINNITLCINPNNNLVSLNAIYHKSTDHVIRNSDKFTKSYMNEQAIKYLETIYANYKEHIGLDAITEYGDIIEDIDAILYSQDFNFIPTSAPDDMVVFIEAFRDTYIKRIGIDAITKDDTILKNIDAIIQSQEFNFDPTTAPDNRVEFLTPNTDLTKILKRKLVDAYVKNSDKVFRGIDAYFMGTEFAFAPNMTSYVVYLNDVFNNSIEIVTRAMAPLDFDFINDKLYEENISESINKIVEYDPSLLNGIYHTYIDSKVFTGIQANESLLYTFMYESRRGLKIPRKRYRDHETYFMIFLNGELYENYYRTICYPNFFFIPVDDEFNFTDTDRVEILYFKNINNNEIRFGMTDWLVNQFTTNDQDINFYNVSVFKPFIKSEELQIFAHYPKDILLYQSIIPNASEEIAFNVSYRDDNNNLCIRKDSLNSIARDNTDTQNAFVAVSKHKFIYQRLYVDQKSYRIKLDKRFRYCDNQRQYLLFVNGRRMKQDSFLITIPKHTRPFNGLYLYTARFINPDDRIELFYLPYEMTDLNIDNNPRCQLKSNGYFEYDRCDINVPLSKDLYLFFINGKKIPYTDIVDIDSSTIRVTANTNTLKYPAITAINTDTIPEVTEYLHNQYKLSKYDSLVNFIKTHSSNTYGELDKLFGCNAQMTDGEDDKVWANVAKIAILNEIVRDFWVTSGYNHQNQLFVYDYEKDEIYENKDDALVIPALDANQNINIIKNDIALLYLYTMPGRLLYELGSYTNGIKFAWEYSQRLNQGWKILSQSIDGISIPVNDREFELDDVFHNESKVFRFETNTGQQIITKDISMQFVNGIYWGVMDEDSLEYYQRTGNRGIQFVDRIVAVTPKDGSIPNQQNQQIESQNTIYLSNLQVDNIIIDNMIYTDSDTISGYINQPFVDEPPETNEYNISHYYNEDNLCSIIRSIDKHLVASTDIKLNNYIIGNNNYFVFACPSRLVYDGYHMHIKFYFPDPYNDDINSHCIINATAPNYTNGVLDSKNLLTRLSSIQMEFMGNCIFTNSYGYTEEYVVWKSNGYFTKLFENFGIDIHIQIGKTNGASIIYSNNMPISDIVNYVNGEEETLPIPTTDERTVNMETPNTETRGTAGTANTLPENDAALVKCNNIITLDTAGNNDSEHVKEMLSQGIFLI